MTELFNQFLETIGTILPSANTASAIGFGALALGLHALTSKKYIAPITPKNKI